jgi:cytoskeletal protein CcmA (bactofilin family)
MEPGNSQYDGSDRVADPSEPATAWPEKTEPSKVLVERMPVSVIGEDIVITGNIEASVDLHIEGQVVGDVRCATLILGESSMVTGRIYAARVKISGTLDGAVETKDLAVEASARVKGKITYEHLRVANGGIIEGTISRRMAGGNTEQVSRLQLVETPQLKNADVEST